MTRILVIDDDVTNAELLRVVLEDAAFEVVTAYSSRDLPGGHFDGVLSDLVTLGAYDLADARDWVLSLRDRYPAVPVIIVTARREARDDEEQLGARVIVKPFDIDMLTATVRELTS